MTCSVSPFVADQLVDCIANNRNPTAEELLALAERMWTEVSIPRSAFIWGELPPDSTERLLALRAAQLALGASCGKLTDENGACRVNR